MTTREPDIKPDMEPAEDRGEATSLMEPLLLGERCRQRFSLADLAMELAQRSTGFRRSLPEAIVAPLAGLLRSMNCYYSNLIEGHDIHPVDIERALHDDFSADPRQRDLQLEARAYVSVQQWIDGGELPQPATGVDAICEIHRRFHEAMPPDLVWTEDPRTGERLRVVPGMLRRRDVQVGQHVPVSPGAVPRFLERFQAVFGQLGTAESVLAAGAAHHRLAWIHPFLDGNGRVVRLMSHATLLSALDTGAVWSISRGLARNVQAYKGHLAACDLPRRNDLDGRGNRSEEALGEFTAFFLQTCLDQVTFMEGLMEPQRLRTRVLMWAEEEIRRGALPPKSTLLLQALLYRGELPRGEIAGLLDVGERQGRRVVAALVSAGAATAASSRAPIHLAFPASLASRWMPGLFPDRST